jgi:hypothetical protein
MAGPNLQETLEASGINASALDRIRLARGVVGKASYVAGAAVLGLALVAWGLRDSIYLIIDASLMFALFLSYFIGVLWFANKHPGVALLEGAELIQWRQLEITASDPPSQIDRTLTIPPMLAKRPENGA